MAITSTTASAAITNLQTTIALTSVTGVTAPNWQTGSGIIVLLIDQEFFLVAAAPTGTTVPVVRGYMGTAAAAHASLAGVQIGNPSDFGPYSDISSQKTIEVSAANAATNQPGINLTGTTDAIDATVPGFYVVKTAAVDAMTLVAPAAAAEGNIIEIVSDTANAHTLTATSLLAGGTALKTTATFPAFRGAYLKLRACNGVWEVLSSGNGNVASFVVLT